MGYALYWRGKIFIDFFLTTKSTMSPRCLERSIHKVRDRSQMTDRGITSGCGGVGGSWFRGSGGRADIGSRDPFRRDRVIGRHMRHQLRRHRRAIDPALRHVEVEAAFF